MDATLTPREEFSAYLQLALPAQKVTGLPRSIDESEANRICAVWRDRAILTVLTTVRGQVLAVLGPADGESTPMELRYKLPYQPGYIYVFDFDLEDRLIGSGFDREAPATKPFEDLGADPQRNVERLITLGATAAELEEWFGPPIERSGWWPMEWWEYPNGIRLSLRHGILVRDPSEGTSEPLRRSPR